MAVGAAERWLAVGLWGVFEVFGVTLLDTSYIQRCPGEDGTMEMQNRNI